MISREEHAFIAYDEEARQLLSAAWRQGQPRAPGRAVRCSAPRSCTPYDLIRIGKTTLRFIPLCGPTSRGATKSGTPERIRGRGVFSSRHHSDRLGPASACRCPACRSDSWSALPETHPRPSSMRFRTARWRSSARPVSATPALPPPMRRGRKPRSAP